jgi:hypothetical protein
MVLARDGNRSYINEVIPAVLVVVTAVSRSGDEGDSYHFGLFYTTFNNLITSVM